MTTRATAKPVVRFVDGASVGVLVAEIRADTLTLRPKGARKGGPAEVSVRWGLVYQLALLRRNK